MDTSFLRSIACGLAALSLAAMQTASAASPPATSAGKLPPLIDREVFFGDPDIAAAQISPNGAYVAFIRPFNGTRNIWVKRTEEAFDRARPVTAEKERPIAGYFWSRDGKYILYVRDNGGDENFNVYAVDPATAPAGGSKVPPARNLTNVQGARAVIYAVPKSAPDLLYIGLNDRDPAWHDVYKLEISTGKKELVLENTDRFTGVHFDLKDQLRLVTRNAPNGDTEILRVGEGAPKAIYTCSVFESCAPSNFHPDGKRVYFTTNRGAEANFVRLTLVDVETGAEELIESDPENQVDLSAPIFSVKTEELIATAYMGDERVRLYWRSGEHQRRYEYVKSRFPDKEIGVVSQTPDERLALFLARSDREPGEVHLYEPATGKLTFQFRIRDDLPREVLAPMRTIRYPSSDGLQIPAYLTLPVGVAPKSLPLVVVPHGGPWARDYWGYNGLAQFLANRGFAVLTPNFRGSTGYGKKFLDAGNKEWGGKMQDDITWGVKHLIAQGMADSQRVAILGGSYGGYATLAGVAFTPDVYTAAVSLVGPSNLITLLNSIPPYWQSFRQVFNERLGDPTNPEDRARLERISPLNSADKIKTPLMVIQGANDPRVKTAESEQIVVALRDRKFPVEYLLAKDEGHGFARPENNIAAFAAVEQFFAKHVPGVRHQRAMSRQTRAQLKKLTVDPKTVVLASTTAPTTAQIDAVAGDWEGILEAGPTKLRLALHLKADGDGKLRGTFDSIDQNAMGLTVDAIQVTDTRLKFELPQVGGSYSGSIESAGRIEGTWTQMGSSLPLDFDKTKAAQ